MDIKIGWSKRKIILKKETRLAGYAPLRLSRDIHDAIFTKVLAIQQSEKWYFLVVLDLIAIDNYFYERIKQGMEEENLPISNLTISVTHTHSAPEGTTKTNTGVLKGADNILGQWDEEYVNLCVEQTIKAAAEAIQKADSATLKVGSSLIDNIGRNRNDKEGPYDEKLLAIEIKLANERKMILYHYACHPTVLSQKNTLISQDFPYSVEEKLNEYELVLFINGNCGDISTRFTRDSSDFSQIEKFGNEIAQKIQEAVQSSVREERLKKLEIKETTINLKSKKVEDAEKAEKRLEQVEDALKKEKNLKKRRLLETKEDGARVNLYLAKNLSDVQSIPLYCQLISINNINILTFPGEIYYELVKDFKLKHNLEIFGYTNGFNFYLTSQNAFDEEYYEALSSPFEKGEGEVFLQKITQSNLLKKGEKNVCKKLF